MTRVANDLVEAYIGLHEDEYRAEHKRRFADELTAMSFDQWAKAHAELAIRRDTPLGRLEVYCQWNGLIGYAVRLFEIAKGEIDQ